MKDVSGTETLESMSLAVWYNNWTVNKFKEFLYGDILEAGCGVGNFTKDLTEYGRVFAVDINKNHIMEISKDVRNIAEVGFGDIEKGQYFFNNNQKFDTVICLNVLEHIKDDKKALKNLYNLLKKGGFLILLVPAYDFLFGEIDKSIGHYRRYNRKDLNNLIMNVGFKIIKKRVLNMLGAIGWWFSSKFLGNSSVDESKIKLFNLIAPLVLPVEDLIEPPFGTSILIIAQK